MNLCARDVFRRSSATFFVVGVIAGLIATFASARSAVAQSTEGVPSPKDFLGYELGDRYTTHARTVDYVKALADVSDRVTWQSYGRTNEDRELLLLFVTSPENHARMDGLRARMAKVADPRTLAAGENVESIVDDLPVFVWLSYNVHGNETSCTEAGLRTLFELASSTEESVTRLLDGAVIIIDPCVNPDGRDRYVNWFNSVVGRRGDPNPESMEHDEPWPGGRYNHYGFDLNRDWAFMTQVETRQRLREFVRWTPQVHVDFHEMGRESTYFFFPADRPINANLPPYTTRWGEVFGRGNASAFDREGWDYYTAENFDLFYPGYGDSWPSFHGAIGMTYEQAGHSTAGITVRQRDGNRLTLKDRVMHHYVASMATIRTAVDNRKPFLLDYHQFRASAVAEGQGGEIREFVLVPGVDTLRADHLVELLIASGVEVRRATESFTARDVTDYLGSQAEEHAFPEGSYIVSLAQPTKRLIKTLLEPRTTIKELYFYDVSAWSLPYAFGIEAWWTRQPTGAKGELVTLPIASPTGKIDEGEPTYGYLLRWDTTASLRATIDLLEDDLVVKSARKPFTLDGRRWERGTVVVPRGANPKDLVERLTKIATKHGVTFVPARTGMTEKGVDFGSSNVVRLRRPKIALLAGDGMSATSWGATRFMIEAVYDVPYSNFDAERLADLDLDDYTALVVPAGRLRLGDAEKKALQKFTASGGVVIALGGASGAFCKERGGPTSISQTPVPVAKDAPKPPEPRTIEERDHHHRKRSMPGSIFRVELDPAHPLAFGYGQEIAVFQSGMTTFDPKTGTVAGRFKQGPPLAGYIPEDSEKRMRDRGYVMVERAGRGAYVLFAGDPNFRSVWHGLTRLFLNAVLLMPRF